MRYKMISIKRYFALVCAVGCVLLISDLTGVHRHFFEKDFVKEFAYPLDIEDFKTLVLRYRNHEPVSHEPINEAGSNIIYLSKADGGCSSTSYRLIILVKSKPSNFDRRAAIRETWGFPKRFSDVPIKTVFLLGFEKDLDDPVHEGQEKVDTSSLDEAIEHEITKYGDVIQGDFHDSDVNSTIKTQMGLRWLVEICSQFRFAVFVSDDMYVSIKNILKFVRHPVEYPNYWENQKELDDLRNHKNFYKRVSRSIVMNNEGYRGLNHLASDGTHPPEKVADLKNSRPILKKPTKVWKNSHVDFDIDLSDDVILYAGNVAFGKTHRNKIGTKYYLTLEEYPFDQMPPFVSSEAIVLSKSAVVELHYASFFTKYLRLDDVFLGICAKKMSIDPFHSKYFQLDPSLVHNPYGKKDFKYVITANNFDDPDGLRRFWNAQKAVGNA